MSHLDPVVLYDDEQNKIYKVVKQTLKSYDTTFHFHDFRVEEFDEHKEIFFDVVIPDSYNESNERLYDKIVQDVHDKIDQPLKINIEFDRNYVLRL